MAGYPLAFRPTGTIDIYDVAGTRLAGPFDIQVFKPMLATSFNTYTAAGKTIWTPGSIILRCTVNLNWTVYDNPGGAGRYFVFLGDPVPKKWRVACAYTWGPAVASTNMTSVFLGEFV